MIKLAFLFAALFAVSASAQEQEEKWQHPDARAEVRIDNLSGRPVTVAMYSQNRIGHKWGPWEVNDNVVPGITCKLDEQICMGAWTPDETTSWGVGRDSSRSCSHCCFRCANRLRGWLIRLLHDGTAYETFWR
jgi:hypothetical protein